MIVLVLDGVSLVRDGGQLDQTVDAHADLEGLAVGLLEPDRVEVPDLLECQSSAGIAPPLPAGRGRRPKGAQYGKVGN